MATTMLMSALEGGPFGEERDDFIGRLKHYTESSNDILRRAHQNHHYQTPLEDHLLPHPDEHHPLVKYLDHQINRAEFAGLIRPTHFHFRTSPDQPWHRSPLHHIHWNPVDSMKDNLRQGTWDMYDRGIHFLHSAVHYPSTTAHALCGYMMERSIPEIFDDPDPLIHTTRHMRNNINSSEFDYEAHPCSGRKCYSPQNEHVIPTVLSNRMGS